ncbi:MAG: type IV-A pilus assembly ATPase PilB [Planctomycetota bacterium]|nr:type IV-A pilus assembly ATPase PilB [Planctomycetota bacterium]
MAKFDKRLKNILVKRGFMAEATAEEALSTSVSEDKSLTDILVDGDYLPEKDIICAVSLEMNIPPIDVNRVEIEPAVLDRLPKDLATYYGALPVANVGDLLTLAVSNPFDILKLDDVRLVTGCEIRPVVSTERSIMTAINKYYNRSDAAMSELMGEISPEMEMVTEQEDEEINLAEVNSDDSPVVKLVNLIIYQAIKDGCSDIHVEPFEKAVRVRCRRDGVLRETISPPKKMQNSLVSRIKIMADLDIAEKRIPQDGKFQLRVEGRQIDFRVSILPTIHGEKVVMRLLDSSSLTLSLAVLGFEKKALDDFQDAIEKPYGMILVTGPTGSGKSTTLYCAVKQIMNEADNITTVEDPVEYQLDGVNQVPVNAKRGLTFAAALRSILRQDPDIIMIGEIRDLETIEIAVKSALTGHLVFSTLHTNDAPSTISRMLDMGVDPFMISSSVILLSAQRLSRKLCEECKEVVPAEDIPPEEVLRQYGIQEDEMKDIVIHRPVGCTKCSEGFKGRFAMLETLPFTDTIKRMVVNRESALDVKKVAEQEGMVTLRRAGLLNVLRGKTGLEEILRTTMADD